MLATLFLLYPIRLFHKCKEILDTYNNLKIYIKKTSTD